MKNTFAWLPLLVALLGCNAATAQDFPTRPIRVVVPFPAGGTADVLPRILAEKLRTRFPAGVVVENKPGAGGNIGAELVSNAEPEDGWQGRTGFVHEAVLQDHPDLSGFQVYACGAPIVIESAQRDYVARGGLPAEEFFADSFTSEADKARG